MGETWVFDDFYSGPKGSFKPVYDISALLNSFINRPEWRKVALLTLRTVKRREFIWEEVLGLFTTFEQKEQKHRSRAGGDDSTPRYCRPSSLLLNPDYDPNTRPEEAQKCEKTHTARYTLRVHDGTCASYGTSADRVHLQRVPERLYIPTVQGARGTWWV